MSKITVLVIDDSALIRKLLTEIINKEPDMEVVGAAPDPLVAREMIRELNPDVLTLDVEMPRMDGIDFLEKINASKTYASSDGIDVDGKRIGHNFSGFRTWSG